MLTEPRSVVLNGVGLRLTGGTARSGGLELRLEGSDLGAGVRWDWSLRNGGRSELRLDRVGIRLAGSPGLVLEQGWQSWSPVRRCRVDDVRPQRLKAPAWTRRMLAADARASGRRVTGDHFLVSEAGVVGAIEGSGNLTTVEADPGRRQGLTVWALLDGVRLGPDEQRRLDPIWTAAGDPGPLYSAYASLWAICSGARSGAASEPGWSSWYQYFGRVDPSAIRSNLELAAELHLRVFQIDDGYQASLGEWLSPAAGGTSLSELAAQIRGRGLRPGIWTAPFLAAEAGPVARDHPEWLLRHPGGRPVRAHRGPLGWALALDTTQPAVLDHLRQCAAKLAGIGFSYQKIDFCYAGALPGRRSDQTATRAEALRRGLDAWREGIGEAGFLLGCGCPLGQAAGIVDAMRVSTDTGPRWAPAEAEVEPGFEESAVCLADALAASLLRAPLHRRLWINDPDCLLLRPRQTALSARERGLAADAVMGLGGFLTLSDDLGLYRQQERELLGRLLRIRERGDTPLELVNPFAERPVVRSGTSTLELGLPLLPGPPSWSLAGR